MKQAARALPLLLAAAAAPVQQVPTDAAEAILGATVQGKTGVDIGRLVDVLVNQDGMPVAAVIDFGGFLGVGNRKIAVDWKSLKFTPGDKDHPITLEMEPDEVRAAPQYKDQKPAPVVGAPGVAAAPAPASEPAAAPAPSSRSTAQPEQAPPQQAPPQQAPPQQAPTEPTKPEPAKPEPAKPEPAKPEPAKPAGGAAPPAASDTGSGAQQ